MLKIQSAEVIPLQLGNTKSTRYVLKATDAIQNDPFVVFADDEFSYDTFPNHPHKGIQTVSYVLEGNISHYDSSSGEGGRLGEGDFQIMTAGRGIIHSEQPDEGEIAHGLQLWVNLSSEHKKVEGNYQDLSYEDVPFIEIDGGKIEVYAGAIGEVASPLKQLTPFNYVVLKLKKGATYKLPVPADFNSFIYVLEGQLKISGELVQSEELVRMGINAEADDILFEAETDSHLVYFGGQPIREPIFVKGPFVMNNQEEMKQSYADYRNGDFLGGKPYDH